MSFACSGMKSTIRGCLGINPNFACMARDKSPAYRGCSSSRIPWGIRFQNTATLPTIPWNLAPLGRSIAWGFIPRHTIIWDEIPFIRMSGDEVNHSYCLGINPNSVCMARDKSRAYWGCSSSRIPSGIWFQNTATLPTIPWNLAPLGRSIAWGFIPRHTIIRDEIPFIRMSGDKVNHSYCLGINPNSVCMARDKSRAYRGCSSSRIPSGIWFV